MKQRTRFLTLTLAVLLVVQLQLPAAYALFTPSAIYQEQFTDVSREDWFHPYVAALYELGLVKGQDAPDRFAPEDNITVAEIVTIAARIRSLYDFDDSEAGPAKYPGKSWYSPYVSYLAAVTDDVDPKLTDKVYLAPATRAQTAHILASALPREMFKAINADQVSVGYASRHYITDVTAYTPYVQDILDLYRWGILSGMDRRGSFHPDEAIQRSEAAAMAARIVREELRIHLDWDVSVDHSKAGTTFSELIRSGGTFHLSPEPADTKAIDQNIRYMLSQGQRTMVLRYPEQSLTQKKVDELLRAFLNGIRGYVEQEYNEVNCTYSRKTGAITVTFSSSLWDDHMLDKARTAIMDKAIEIHDTLWSDGTIDSSMSEYEKARVYFTWLCENCTYDYSAKDDSVSHSGYGALIDGLAVCDGYTAAYNLLLKLEGIRCTTMSTADHIWTVAVLDGTPCHIDPTWGDMDTAISYRYFAMTETDSLARFK